MVQERFGKSTTWLVLAAVAAVLIGLIGFGMRTLPETRVSAQQVSFADSEGSPVNLATFGGKVVLLNVWATWCVPCRKEMPALDRLQAELGGPDFQVVTLSIDSGGATAVRAFYEQVGVRHLPIFVDTSGTMLHRLRAPGLPTTLLFDRNGQEIGRFVGPAEWDSPRFIEIISKAVSSTGKENS